MGNLFNNEPLVKKAATYAKQKHKATNHKYDEVYSYTMHLKMVYNYAIKYIHSVIFLYSEAEILAALAAAWVHDVIEDARETYNDVKKATNKNVADIAYALTNYKGKTRSQRAGKSYYKEIKSVPLADYIKICDRLANIKYSSLTQSTMLDVYRKEHDHFKTILYKPEYKDMFAEMEEMLKEVSPEEVYYARKMNERYKFLQQSAKNFWTVIFITTLLIFLSYILIK